MTLDPLTYRTPAIRHLAWMLTAPQLLNDQRCVDFSDHINERTLDMLCAWDRHPELRPAALNQPVPRRLGLYFEHLYAVLLSDLLGGTLLARNLPVRKGGHTLGELDFLVRNPTTGTVEHHEIAVKFYLGVYENARGAALWYGPDTEDRLDIKTERMLEHQCRMTERPETRALLGTLDIAETVETRVFMPGYLFYPLNDRLAPPTTAADRHLRGYWLSSSQLCAISTHTWVPLQKPHWIGPWQQDTPPDAAALEQAFSWVETRSYPRLFAAMKPRPDGSGWVEHARYFVTPKFWPGICSLPLP